MEPYSPFGVEARKEVTLVICDMKILADFDWAPGFPSPGRLVAGWSLLGVLESFLMVQEQVKLLSIDSVEFRELFPWLLLTHRTTLFEIIPVQSSWAFVIRKEECLLTLPEMEVSASRRGETGAGELCRCWLSCLLSRVAIGKVSP